MTPVTRGYHQQMSVKRQVKHNKTWSHDILVGEGPSERETAPHWRLHVGDPRDHQEEVEGLLYVVAEEDPIAGQLEEDHTVPLVAEGVTASEGECHGCKAQAAPEEGVHGVVPGAA